jgi:hypothetical protein
VVGVSVRDGKEFDAYDDVSDMGVDVWLGKGSCNLKKSGYIRIENKLHTKYYGVIAVLLHNNCIIKNSIEL